MNDDDIKVLMARLPLRMQLITLARTWGVLEKMMEPTKEHIERVQAARKAAGRGDSDF
jgi:hypothetical protein